MPSNEATARQRGDNRIHLQKVINALLALNKEGKTGSFMEKVETGEFPKWSFSADSKTGLKVLGIEPNDINELEFLRGLGESIIDNPDLYNNVAWRFFCAGVMSFNECQQCENEQGKKFYKRGLKYVYKQFIERIKKRDKYPTKPLKSIQIVERDVIWLTTHNLEIIDELTVRVSKIANDDDESIPTHIISKDISEIFNNDDSDSISEYLEDRRERAMRNVVNRRGQKSFHDQLQKIYGGECAITDCDVAAALEAAHIMPYRGGHTNRLSNGLLLRADIHKLFDLHLISINPETRRVVISFRIDENCYEQLADRTLKLPTIEEKSTIPSKKALDFHYKKFLRKTEAVFLAYKLRGEEKCSFPVSDFDGAIDDFSEAIHINSNSDEAYRWRGWARFIIRDTQGAIDDLSRAIDINPNSDEAYRVRGLAKCYLGDKQGEIADYTKAISICNDDTSAYDIYHRRGLAKHNLGDYQGAIVDYTKAISIYPNTTRAYEGRRNTKHMLGDNQGAIDDHIKLVSHSLNGEGFSICSFEVDDFFKETSISSNDARAYSDRGYEKYGLGDNQGAIDDFSEAIRINPNDSEAYISRGDVKLALGDKQGQLEDYQKARQL